VNPFFYGRENDRLGEPLLFDVAKWVSRSYDIFNASHDLTKLASN
jgi:hypothetical protein